MKSLNPTRSRSRAAKPTSSTPKARRGAVAPARLPEPPADEPRYSLTPAGLRLLAALGLS